MTPTEQMKSWLYYNALSVCVSNVALIDTTVGFLSIHNRIYEADALAGKWFDNPSTFASNPTIGYPLSAAGVTVSPSGDKVGCGGDNVAWIKDAISLWGYKDGIDALCDTGAQRANGSNCRDGSGDFKGDHAGVNGSAIGGDYLSLSIFQKNIKDRIYGGSNPTMDDASRYTLARNSFYEGCLGTASPVEYTGTAKDGFLYNSVKVVGTDGVVKDTTFYGKLKGSDSIWYSVSPNGANITSTCTNLVNDMARYANAFSDYVYKTIKAGKTPAGIAPVDCSLTPNDSSCSTTGTTSCGIHEVGWIVCPMMTFLGSLTDGAFTIVSNLLSIDPGILSTTPGTGGYGVFSAWQSFRDIANVLLLVVFMIIIYSQLTGVGMTNYGVKKLLPRLVVTAILINVSFYICQIAVDISNILGSSLYGFFKTIPLYAQSSSFLDSGSAFTNVIGATLIGGGAVAATSAALAGTVLVATMTGALSILIPVIIVGLMAIVVILFILMTRPAIVIFLTFLAPIAFVAMLLPNTQSIYKRWQKYFVAVLTLYPMMGLLLGGSRLAAGVLIQNASFQGFGVSDIASNIGAYISAVVVILIPLFLIIPLIKSSLNFIPMAGQFAAKLNKLGYKGASMSRKGIAKSGEWAAANADRKGRLGRFAGGLSTATHGIGRVGREHKQQALRAYEEPRIRDQQGIWEKDGTASNFDALEDIANTKGIDSLEGRTALGMLAAKGASTHVQRVRNGGTRKGKDDQGNVTETDIRSQGQNSPNFDRTIAPYFGALKAKDYRAVGLHQNPDGTGTGKLDIAKASDMYTMTDDALVAGAQADASFRKTLQEAASDPEQSRYFSPFIKQYSKTMGASSPASATTPPAQTTPQQPTTTNPFIVDSNGVINQNTARARAEAVVAQAAQGTSGDTPFIVDHSGTASQPKQAGDVGSHIDDQGRATPDGAAEGYHDYFNH